MLMAMNSFCSIVKPPVCVDRFFAIFDQYITAYLAGCQRAATTALPQILKDKSAVVEN